MIRIDPIACDVLLCEVIELARNKPADAFGWRQGVNLGNKSLATGCGFVDKISKEVLSQRDNRCLFDNI
jgi:hypothetical protein